uniref:C2H2-type domain-containing protein n=1 Tax=Stomoxys calcitrans TaxID=35570 RepID=A0A1I8PQK3_STOCA
MADLLEKDEKPDIRVLREGLLEAEKEKNQFALKNHKLANYRLKQDYKVQQQHQQTPMSSIESTRKRNNGLAKGSRATHKRKRLGAASMTSSRCGMIYVTQNARKWTFVCTFCQKTTRDIGEFVCHIKYKHMGNHYDDEEDENDEDIGNGSEKDHNVTMEDGYNQGQDYFDCANYLDVNVHTEEDEQQAYRSQAKTMQSAANGNDVVNLLDEEEDDNNATPFFDYEYDAQEDEEELALVDDSDRSNRRTEEDNNHLMQRRASADDESHNGDFEESNNGDASGSGNGKRYRTHVRGTAYCKLCDKTFQYYSLYRNHMIKHSNVTPYKCQFCTKGFKSKQAIRYHMKTHSKEKEFQCPLCPTTYATSSLFMTHVLSHESATCFPCMVCAVVLKTEQERELHLETHAEDRPHSCNFCGKRFRQKHHLSNHLKLHCQYRCDFCRESFSSTQTQRRPYACPTCEELPDIRTQVERQRSFSMKQPVEDPPPMEFENIMIKNEATREPECVDLEEMPSDDDSEGGNTPLLVSTPNKTYPQCKYCRKIFEHVGALNMHIRQEHSQ